MIVFLLLVIIAILLFGSSAVLGAVGALLGFIVLVLAIVISGAAFASSLGITFDDLLTYAIFGFCVLIGFLACAAALGKSHADWRQQKASLDAEAYAPASDPARRDARERAQADTEAAARADFNQKFHSRRPDAPTRKRLRDQHRR